MRYTATYRDNDVVRVRDTREVDVTEAFALLAASQLGPAATFEVIEPNKIVIVVCNIAGPDQTTHVYESDDPAELLPLFTVIGYAAYDNRNDKVLRWCNDMLACTTYAICPELLDAGLKIRRGGTVAAVVAATEIDPEPGYIYNYLIRHPYVWRLAKIAAKTFSNRNNPQWRTAVQRELAAA